MLRRQVWRPGSDWLRWVASTRAASVKDVRALRVSWRTMLRLLVVTFPGAAGWSVKNMYSTSRVIRSEVVHFRGVVRTTIGPVRKLIAYGVS